MHCAIHERLGSVSWMNEFGRVNHAKETETRGAWTHRTNGVFIVVSPQNQVACTCDAVGSGTGPRAGVVSHPKAFAVPVAPMVRKQKGSLETARIEVSSPDPILVGFYGLVGLLRPDYSVRNGIAVQGVQFAIEGPSLDLVPKERDPHGCLMRHFINWLIPKEIIKIRDFIWAWLLKEKVFAPCAKIFFCYKFFKCLLSKYFSTIHRQQLFAPKRTHVGQMRCRQEFFEDDDTCTFGMI